MKLVPGSGPGGASRGPRVSSTFIGASSRTTRSCTFSPLAPKVIIAAISGNVCAAGLPLTVSIRSPDCNPAASAAEPFAMDAIFPSSGPAVVKVMPEYPRFFSEMRPAFSAS